MPEKARIRGFSRLRRPARAPLPRRMRFTRRVAISASGCASAEDNRRRRAAPAWLANGVARAAIGDALAFLTEFLDELQQIFIEGDAQQLMARRVFLHSDESQHFVFFRRERHHQTARLVGMIGMQRDLAYRRVKGPLWCSHTRRQFLA